jgi:hypothetical protein
MIAIKGFRRLEVQEVKDIYGDPPVYTNLKWPVNNRVLDSSSNKNTWTMSGYFDCCKIPVIAQVIELMEQGIIKDKTYTAFAYELLELDFAEHRSNTNVKAAENNGKFYKRLLANPLRYIQP